MFMKPDKKNSKSTGNYVYDPTASISNWNEEQRKVIMGVLDLSLSDLENPKMWSKWLKHYFSDEIFADYGVFKMSLEEWLKDVESDWSEEDNPFELNRAFLLKMYYDDVRRNRLMEFLVQNAKGGEAEKILKTTPGFGPDEISPRSYDERVAQIEEARDMAQKIAKDSIGYIKWLISNSKADVKKQAFEHYRTIQKWLMRFELLKLCVVNVDTVNEPPKLFHFCPETQKYLESIKDMSFGLLLRNCAEMTEEKRAECRSSILEKSVSLFRKRLTRREIETAFKFIFDGVDDTKTLRKAYRYFYEYANCLIFLTWRRLRATLNILEFTPGSGVEE